MEDADADEVTALLQLLATVPNVKAAVRAARKAVEAEGGGRSPPVTRSRSSPDPLATFPSVASTPPAGAATDGVEAPAAGSCAAAAGTSEDGIGPVSGGPAAVEAMMARLSCKRRGEVQDDLSP